MTFLTIHNCVHLQTTRNLDIRNNLLHKNKAERSSAHFLYIYISCCIAFDIHTVLNLDMLSCLWNCCSSWLDIFFVCNPSPFVRAYLLYIWIKAPTPYAK